MCCLKWKFDICSLCRNTPPDYLQMRFHQLKLVYVPGWKTMSFCGECCPLLVHLLYCCLSWILLIHLSFDVVYNNDQVSEKQCMTTFLFLFLSLLFSTFSSLPSSSSLFPLFSLPPPSVLKDIIDHLYEKTLPVLEKELKSCPEEEVPTETRQFYKLSEIFPDLWPALVQTPLISSWRERPPVWDLTRLTGDPNTTTVSRLLRGGNWPLLEAFGIVLLLILGPVSARVLLGKRDRSLLQAVRSPPADCP